MGYKTDRIWEDGACCSAQTRLTGSRRVRASPSDSGPQKRPVLLGWGPGQCLLTSDHAEAKEVGFSDAGLVTHLLEELATCGLHL